MRDSFSIQKVNISLTKKFTSSFKMILFKHVSLNQLFLLVPRAKGVSFERNFGAALVGSSLDSFVLSITLVT